LRQIEIKNEAIDEKESHECMKVIEPWQVPANSRRVGQYQLYIREGD
jgi:hypothetical protein